MAEKPYITIHFGEELGPRTRVEFQKGTGDYGGWDDGHFLRLIEVVSTRREPLNAITREDCVLEGFPEMEPEEFVRMLVEHYGCNPDDEINRIEFRYVEQERT